MHGEDGTCLREAACRVPPAGASDLQQAIYEEFHVRLLAFARHLTLTSEDAEDLIGDLYAAVPALMPELSKIENTFAYLCGCLRRFAANERAKHSRQRKLLHALPGPEGRSDPSERILLGVLCQQILERIPVSDANLLTWTYLNEKTVADMGILLGRSGGAVRVRLYRARCRARRSLPAIQLPAAIDQAVSPKRDVTLREVGNTTLMPGA